MNEKQVQIIEVAIQLFAKKGYHLTSIQEIADAAGIAKGSMYLYFKSKEELLLSVYKYYYDLFSRNTMYTAKDLSLSPKERLHLQLVMQFENIIQHRSFIKMQMKEQSIPLNEEIKQFLFSVRASSFEWFYSHLIDIYGEDIKPYALDGAVIFNGMMKEYMGHMILDNKRFDTGKLVSFIIAQIDYMMKGLLADQPEPFLDERMMAEFLAYGKQGAGEHLAMQLSGTLKQLRELAEQSSLEAKQRNEIMNALGVIQDELEQAEPRTVLIQGMLSYLNGFQLPEAEPLLKEIYDYMELKDSAFDPE